MQDGFHGNAEDNPAGHVWLTGQEPELRTKSGSLSVSYSTVFVFFSWNDCAAGILRNGDNIMNIDKEDLKIKGICVLQLAIAVWYIWKVLRKDFSLPPSGKKRKR